mmetsp:Transcript_18122/g.16034  ORF Transcript_18122/g.16034 Transcript_18122/m.16034 type:complete len:96 (-) Transcript_18122:31-318(-)
MKEDVNTKEIKKEQLKVDFDKRKTNFNIFEREYDHKPNFSERKKSSKIKPIKDKLSKHVITGIEDGRKQLYEIPRDEKIEFGKKYSLLAKKSKRK